MLDTRLNHITETIGGTWWTWGRVPGSTGDSVSLRHTRKRGVMQCSDNWESDMSQSREILHWWDTQAGEEDRRDGRANTQSKYHHVCLVCGTSSVRLRMRRTPTHAGVLLFPAFPFKPSFFFFFFFLTKITTRHRSSTWKPFVDS